MAVYRITRFSSSDMDKAMELAESVRASMSEIKFDFIDVAQDDQGNGVVIARYPDAGAMEEATATARNEGVVEPIRSRDAPPTTGQTPEPLRRSANGQQIGVSRP